MARHHFTSEPSTSAKVDNLTDRQTGTRDGMEPASVVSPETRADMSVWIIWAVIMLLAIAVLPFAVRSQDVVRALAAMCGFDLG